MSRSAVLVALACLLALPACLACVTSPLGRRQLQLFPEDQMAEMGVAAFAQMREKVPVSNDARLRRSARCVADAITAELPSGGSWEVTVFDDPSANAFALPGGKIGVHSGLFEVARTQDQLATVLGHEVAHVLANHSNERVSQAYLTAGTLAAVKAVADEKNRTHSTAMALLGLGAQYGVLMPYGRAQESEADLLGLDLMAKAGFDPRESIALWQNMQAAAGAKPPEFLSTHPSHDTRVRDLQGRMDHALGLYGQARRQGKQPRCS